MVSTRQVFNCAPISSKTETIITNPKLVVRICVKEAVWVRKPGPMEELAMRNAAPKVALNKLNLNGFRCRLF
jgi:hypothetical protein